MKNKKLTLLFSSIGIFSIVGLCVLFNSGIGTSTNVLDSHQSLNTRIESKEEIIVNKKLSEIFDNPILTKEDVAISDTEAQSNNEFVDKIEKISEIKEEIKQINKDVVSDNQIKQIENKIEEIQEQETNETNIDSIEIIKPEKLQEEIKKEDNNSVEKEDTSTSLPEIRTNDTDKEDVVENINIDTKSNNIVSNSEPTEDLDIQTVDNKEIVEDVSNKEDNKNEEKTESLQEYILQPETPLIKNIISSTNSLSVNFDKTINTEKYACYYGEDNSKLDKTGTIIEVVNGMQCSINNLKDGTKYYVQIQSINKDKISKSDIKSSETEFISPTKQKNISSAITDSSIKLTYTVSENATRYSCYYKEKDTSVWSNTSNLVIDDNNIYCEIGDLKENTTYDFKISAINGNKSVDSDISTFTTEYSKPSVPVIKHINIDKNKAEIIFDKSSNASSYLCRYGLNENNLNIFGSTIISDNEVVCQLNNLNPNTSYYIEILAYNHTVSNKLNTFKITTNQLVELSKPILLETKSNANEIDMMFNIYTGNPEKFSCMYGNNKDELNFKGSVVKATNTMANCRLSNLKEGQSYFVKLIAQNVDFTKESEIYEVKTDYITPTKAKLIDSDSTNSQINVTFSKTENTKKYVCYYGESNSNLNLEGNISVDGDYVKCLFDNLNENSDYFVRMVSINGDKNVSSDIFKIRTKNLTPEKPLLVNKYQTNYSAKVVYSQSTYAKEYKGYFGINDKNLVEIPIVQNENNIELLKNDLNENTKYYFKLVAINGDKSTESDIVEVTTLEKEIAIPVLINSNTTSNILTINYNVEDNLDVYMCYYGTDKNNLDNSANAIKTKNNERQCVINNLNENTQYYFKMVATKNGKVISSDINTNKTEYSTPNIPNKIKESVTNNSLMVEYNISSNITDYICKIGTDENNINTKINSSKNGNVITCSTNNLLSKTTYFVKLEVINGNKTNNSNILSLTTSFDTPSKPAFISENIDKNSVTAVYSVSDNATDYICYYGKEINAINNVGTVTVKNNKVNCTFNNLEEGNRYLYKVTAINHNEIFTNSDIKLVNIPYTEPDKPVLNNVVSTTNSIKTVYNINNNYSYICKYGTDRNNLDKDGTILMDLDNTLKCEMNPLNENTEYYFQLTAINGNKTTKSDISSTKTLVKVDENNLEVPKFVNIPTKLSNSVTVNYTDTKDAYVHYCYYGDKESNMSYKVTANYVDGYAQCHLNNVDISEDIYVKMRAYKKDGVTYVETDTTKIEKERYIPEKPVLKEITKDFENIITSYNTGGAMKEFKCYAGTSVNNLNIQGTFASYGNTQLCGFTKLQPNTKYYVRIDNVYDKETTSSDIKEIVTDKLNGCIGNGPNIENLTDYTVKVNSTCAVNENSSAIENATTVARKLASIDTLKVLDDYPQYDFKSLADIIPIYNPDRTISGFYADVILYRPGNMSDVIGEYDLYKGFNRNWIIDLP